MRSPLVLFGLVALGLIAAVCAALLVAFLKVDPMRQMEQAMDRPVTVVLATSELPALTVLDESHLESDTLQSNEAPGGYLASKSQVIGEVLLQAVQPGQVLTKSLFARAGTGKSVAGKLPGEKRAITISLSADAAILTLLYPGCIVDALASFELPRGNDKGTALSTTLVENVEVLAVGNLAVGEEPAEEGRPAASSSRGVLVTLMVDPEQAKALQLAQRHGEVSLALRNPVEGLPDASDVMVLNEGEMARLAVVLERLEAAKVALDRDQEVASQEAQPAPLPPPVAVEVRPPQPEPVAATEPIQIEVFRGITKEVCTFDAEGGRT